MLKKCPRCELNYVRPFEKICKVCLNEKNGDRDKEEMELCSICNESPVLLEQDICSFCKKEMDSDEATNGEDDSLPRGDKSVLEIENVSSMDEIIPQIHDDIPEKEYGEIETELSLERVREEEDCCEDED